MEDLKEIQKLIHKCKEKIDTEDRNIDTLQNALLEAEDRGYIIDKDPNLLKIKQKCEYCKGYQQAIIDLLKLTIDARTKLTIINSKKLHEIK